MTETEFKKDVFAHIEYDLWMLDQFFDYWSEANKRNKMRFELEKTWDLKKRLKRWHLNNLNWNKNANITKLGTSAARVEALRTWGTNNG